MGGNEIMAVAYCLQQKLGRTYKCVVYADDLIVCARTREQIEVAKSIIEEWLQPRGLTLHPEKTRIVHIDDGINFLSFSIRRYGGKCLVKPQKEKVLGFLAKLRLWLNQHKQARAEFVIRHFNSILPGWSTHYKHAVSKRVFAYVSFQIWKMLWHWCLRRHPDKGKYWVRKKYFGSQVYGGWRFQARCGNNTLYLFDVSSVPIERHAKVKGAASPDDPALQEYWKKRVEERKTRARQRKVTKARNNTESDARAV